MNCIAVFRCSTLAVTDSSQLIICLPVCLLHHLLPVLNASEQRIFHLHRPDHITKPVQGGMFTYNMLHGTALHYLVLLVRVADLPGRHGLCPANTNNQVEPLYNIL